MSKTESIMNALYALTPKGEKLSKPFVVNVEGENKVACFVYSTSFSEQKTYLTDLFSVYLIDYHTLDMDEFEAEGEVELPIEINFSDETVEDNLKQIQNEYFECIDGFFEHGRIDREKTKKLFSAIEYDELRVIYNLFGAKFI